MREEYKTLNFYRHRVQISIEGFRGDKLLATAFRQGIIAKNVRMVSDTEITAWLSYQDYKKIKKLARTVYRITIIRQAGSGAKIKEARRNSFVIIGIAMSAAIILVRSLFVAEIVVEGYKAIPEQSLRQCLAESGIHEGAYRPSLKWDKARADIYDTFPQVTWVKLVYDGTVVYLDIAEASSLPEEKAGTDSLPEESAENNGAERGETENGDAENPQESLKYTNLVAAESGYIESVQPLWGEAEAEAGDFVKKGQILITGEIPIEPTTFEKDAPDRYYVKARGEVWAKVPYRLNFAQERYENPAAEAAKAKDKESGENSQRGKSTEKIIIANKQERTKEQIKAKAEQQLRLWAKENLPKNAEILNKSLNFTAKENIIEVGVTLEVRREITEEQEITVGQKNSDYRSD